MYFNKETASNTELAAWSLCQIIDDDAPMRWNRYRSIAECIARNDELMTLLLRIQPHSAIERAVATERKRLAVVCANAAERYLAGNFGEAAGACTHMAAQIAGER